MRIQERAYSAERQRHHSNQPKEKRKACKAAAFEIFAFRLWHGL